MKNIAIFGITSNPPHKGHISAIEQFVSDFEEVWVNVAYAHPFNKAEMASYEDRLEMTKLILKEHNMSNVIVKELDKEHFEKTQSLPIYTCDVLKALKEDDYSLILGIDNKEVLHKFKNYQYILSNYPIFYAKPVQAFHSTDVRRAIKDNTDISYATGQLVADYIKRKQLYQESL